MEFTDAALRIHVYEQLIAFGHAPTCAEIAQHFGTTSDAVRARLAALRIGKTILVDPRSGELWMAGPFSAAPSAYRLSDGTTTWYANCAWDMFGVAVLVGRPLIAETACPDCDGPMVVACHPDRPPVSGSAVIHFLLPARRWYDDIGFT